MFDSDADIIDYQVAIVEYANGVGMNFHTNLNAPDQFRRFAIFGTRGQAEGDFIRGFFDVTDVLTETQVVHKEYAATELSQHYGADETDGGRGRRARDATAGRCRSRRSTRWRPGILALAMDEARKTPAGASTCARSGTASTPRSPRRRP